MSEPSARLAAGSARWAFAVSAALAAASAPAAEAPALPPELTASRVTFFLRFDDAPEFSPAFRDHTRGAVLEWLSRTVGERWAVTWAAPGGGEPAFDLATLSPDAVPVERRPPAAGASRGFPADAAPDKVVYVSVGRRGAAYLASAREWDRVSDGFGPTRTTAAATRVDLPRAIVAAAVAAYRPVAQVGRADDAAAAVALAGSAIPTPDPSAGTPPPGTLFVVFLRKFDRDGTLTEVRGVPFTYLELTADPGRAAIRSALRRPLAGRRGRVEAWAVAAPAVAAETRLTIARRDDGVPLSGRVVEVRSQAAEPGKAEPAAEASLLTDRGGAVALAADPKRPLSWLTVKSGDATLMRLPLAAGVEPAVTLPLGDDQRRVDAESRIAIVTGDLIETVAKRATLLAKARTGGRTGRYDQADAALAEAATLPDAAAFRRRLAAIAAPAAETAEMAGDRLAAARIRALGRKATGLVDRYLGAEAVRITREEVEELKRTDPDRVPQPKPPGKSDGRKPNPPAANGEAKDQAKGPAAAPAGKPAAKPTKKPAAKPKPPAAPVGPQF